MKLFWGPLEIASRSRVWVSKL